MADTLALGQRAIMTIKTRAHGLRMVNSRCRNGNPRYWPNLVTGVTQVTGWYMVHSPARGYRTIVACHAIADDMLMINIDYGHWRPGYRPRFMAGFTDITRWHVRGCLATGYHAIMTGRTRSRNLGVVNAIGRYWHPRGREFVMAGIADVAAVDMVDRLARCR